MRVAVVGSGISGLYCAHLLAHRHEVTLFEKDARPGGHANTVVVERGSRSIAIDTGFIVFNERNYPGFSSMLGSLGVASQPSEMTFSLRDLDGLEWRPSDLNGIFAQRKNLLRPSFWRMVLEIPRFHRAARSVIARDDDTVTVGELLRRGGFSPGFRDRYLQPLGSSIWSASSTSFLEMPALTVGRFFDNHGLLGITGRPQWRTVTGGSVRYVEALLAATPCDLRLSTPVLAIARDGLVVNVTSPGGVEPFDHVVVAAHAPDALALLADASSVESSVLGAFGYEENDAVLHTDSRLMPAQKRAWASWNAHRIGGGEKASLTYDLTRLQRIPGDEEFLVTLNATAEIDPDCVLARFAYAHPSLDRPAIAAQRRWAEVNGPRRTWFCGAYWRYGFHEDGLQSAVRVAEGIGALG